MWLITILHCINSLYRILNSCPLLYLTDPYLDSFLFLHKSLHPHSFCMCFYYLFTVFLERQCLFYTKLKLLLIFLMCAPLYVYITIIVQVVKYTSVCTTNHAQADNERSINLCTAVAGTPLPKTYVQYTEAKYILPGGIFILVINAWFHKMAFPFHTICKKYVQGNIHKLTHNCTYN